MKSKKFISVLFSVCLALLIITFSIGLPIYIRPFYYVHIEAYDLPEFSGYSAVEIKEAYDDVLDFLTKPGKEFGIGVMRYSESGASHFKDVKGLFNLNVIIFIVSLVVVSILLVLKRKKRLTLNNLGKHSPAFWGALGAVVIPLLLGAMVSINFEGAFYVFHYIFFPGNDDWIFDPRMDEIIDVMPPEFFMNSAILIGASVLLISGTIIAVSLKRRKIKSGATLDK